jgi:predicted dehydrogenase
MPQPVRVGLIGAGSFTTGRMLPGFQKQDDVSLTVIANRTRGSAEKVAAQFGIPRIAEDYRAVIASPDVDAVFIGTPPHLHKEATIAALEAGKHVLCQTRIATSAAEARDMLEYAQEAKARGVQTMLVPPGPFHRGWAFVDHLVKSGYLGTLRHVLGFNVNASFADPSTPLSAGRNDLNLYGQYNAMQLGLSYDVMARWTGHATSVTAQRTTFVPRRPLTPGGPMADNPYPDQVTVLAETAGGAVAMNMVNYAVHFADPRIELYGSEGTVVYQQRGDVILGARVEEQSLQPLPIPPEHDNPWGVEEEFIRLVRGEIAEPSFTFADGVKNMEYLEAAYYSAVEGRRIDLR